MAKSNALVKSSDFANYEYSILMGNTTSQTEIHESAKIRIIEFLDKGVTLQLPISSCAVSHMLTLFVFPGIHGKKVEQLPSTKGQQNMILITSKVIEKTPSMKPGFAFVKVDFYQYNVQQWEAFRRKFGKLQAEVNRVFKIIKE